MIGDETEDRGSVPFTVADRINQVCDRFESDWRAGERPRIEDRLAGVTGPERILLVRELLAVELHWRRKGGEQPAPGEYLERIPQGAEAVHAAFGRTDTLSVVAGPRPESTLAGRGCCEPSMRLPGSTGHSLAGPGRASAISATTS